MALYPHQYTSLSGGVNTSYTYASPRGAMKVHNATSFTTTDLYHGVLPFLPPTGGYSASTLTGQIDSIASESSHFSATETYGLGKQFNRLAQLMPLAKTVNDTNALNNFKGAIESKMQSWFTAPSGKTTNLFYYDKNWGTLIGYPASYGSDNSLNDHHFHYGYWIHSAALTGLIDPNWLSNSNWGGMVDQLRQDIANTDRGNTQYPFLRYFDVYAGHSWASGQVPFGDGGNEESSSEAVNAWVGLILYGSATGNTQVRDTGIWLYTQETNAVFDYWFNDGPVATFPSGFNHTTVANLFDAKSDTGTWFGGQPDFEHGIEFLPFTGGSLYLGRDPSYVQRNYNELYAANGNSVGPDWPDIMEEFEAFVNPSDALNQWNSTTFTFDGETRAHEYYWLSELSTLGKVDYGVTANTPLYAVFKNPSGAVTHAAYNAGTSSLTVTFSDGHMLSVPAGSIASEYGTVSLSGGAGTVNPPPPSLPAAPSGLSSTATSSTQINLSWTASSTAGVAYNVYRSTTAGFTPASSNRIGSVSSTTYSDTALTANTTYYYLVRASNSAGESGSTNQTSATTQSASTSGGAPIFINAGGGATGSWVADVDFNGGAVATPVTTAIDTSMIPSPAPPQSVYQTERYGPMTYTIGGLTSGRVYTAQLHFAETYWPAAGKRQFNVLINGAQVLTNFDIFANANGPNKAIEQNFGGTANSSGMITIQFTTGAADLPKVDGIAVF